MPLGRAMDSTSTAHRRANWVRFNEMQLPADGQATVIFIRRVWYQFIDLEASEGLVGLDGIQTKNLNSKCMQQTTPPPTVLPRAIT